jgi:hypothetical protein
VLARALPVVLLAVCVAATPAAAAAQPLPLGTLTLNSQTDPSCPAGHTCQGFQVTCPGIQLAARGFLGTATATAVPRAVVVLSSGGGGTGWWSGNGSLTNDFIAGLRADGFTVVQLRWVDPWLRSAAGEDAGSAHLACRPSTVFKWVHDNVYLPLGVGDPYRIGRCGFCISGNSGGASQSSYPLSHYGLEPLLDASVPTSGPPHAAQGKGCLRNAGQEAYWYAASSTSTIDSSYGFAANGPCALHDPAFVPRWDEESVDTQGNDYFHDRTRVRIILGGMDGTSAVAHAQDYIARLEAEGTPYFSSEVVPSMPHGIQGSADGLAALGTALRHPGFEAPYPRPKGASPLRASLVPAYQPCASPNRTHGPPLASGSCAPPQQSSGFLTVGTADSNGQPAGAVGHVRMSVIPGDPGTTADEADIAVTASITDVREQGSLADYLGELQAAVAVRLTDRASGPGLDESATVGDFTFSFPLACATTPDPASGAICTASTTADALIPGVAVERKRAIWALSAVDVFDGGADGDVDTPGNTLFARQGVFVP